MKNLILLFLLFLFSCKEQESTIEEKTVAPIEQPAYTAPPEPKYYFGAVDFSYPGVYLDERKSAVLVGEIIESPFLNEDDQYRMLDNISSSVYITTHNGYSIDERKIYTFNSYREASIKRQEIIKTGIK